ncbi:unnamed protein product [Bemisia tabaci]|uniref:Ribosomal biogenesis protein LAS1L n=1 Tax=Bemisia tabaci TaxID=7038 RepID=A0A9P0EY64_BEMTA|nr:unnamed protein product [Bemisia tabaci]
MDNKRIVPWFSMDEWKYVRELLYSSELSDLEKGYQILQVWKVRCPILPVGVECTMEIVKVMLEDKIASAQNAAGGKVCSQVYSLEPIYTSVIMRSLNFITELKSAEVSTMYRAASELNIPDWIVNIRHDAAHGRAFPPLYLLQSAIEFIFNWLQENYWADEADISQGYSVPEEGEKGWEEKLANLIQHYVSISKLCQSGVSTLDQLHSSPEGKALLKKLDEDGLLKSFQLADTDFILLTDVRQKFSRRLQRIIEQKSSKSKNDEVLINIFTVEATNMLSGSEDGSLPREWVEIWWQILKHLSRNTVYNLVLALKDLANADEGSRGKMAAYWLSEFFSVFKNSANPVSSDIETLNPNQLPDKSKLQLLVENVCLNPSKTTVHYLPRLLDLREPKLDRKKRKLIIELHKIYLGKKISSAEDNEVVKSIENLFNEPHNAVLNGTDEENREMLMEEEEEVPAPESQPGPFGIWSRAQGDFGWNACPIGVVPWQRQRTLPDWSMLASL